jgi:hypothetical protein
MAEQEVYFVTMPDGENVPFPVDFPIEEVANLVVKAYPNAFPEGGFRQEGESAAPDDPMGVSTAGMQVPTQAGANQAAKQWAQGFTLGTSPHIEAAGRSLVGDATYDQELRNIYGGMDQAARESGAGTAAEITGLAMNPLGYGRLATMMPAKMGQAFLESKIGRMLAGTPMKETLTRAGGGGAVYGGSTERGEPVEKATSAALTGGGSMLMGGVTQKVFEMGSKAAYAFAKRADTTKLLNDAKKFADQAYKDADIANQTINPDVMTGLFVRTNNRLAQDVDFGVGDMKFVQDAFKMMQARANKGVSFKNLEDLRGELFSLKNQAYRNGADTQAKRIDAIINDLNETVLNTPVTGDKIAVAREAWKVASRADAIDDAMKEAVRRTAKAGSGGNLLNNMIQEVDKLLKSSEAKFFDKELTAALERFVVEGGGNSTLARTVSKLSPDGNGLMMALSLLGGATTQSPLSLLPAAAGYGTKKVLEGTAGKRIDDIMQQVLTGKQTQPWSAPYSTTGNIDTMAAEELQRRIRGR